MTDSALLSGPLAPLPCPGGFPVKPSSHYIESAKTRLTVCTVSAIVAALGVPEMPDLRIEKFPDDLYRALKVKAAQEGTTVKALMIAAAEKLVGKVAKS